jgi:hypothetical protein
MPRSSGCSRQLQASQRILEATSRAFEGSCRTSTRMQTQYATMGPRDDGLCHCTRTPEVKQG